MTVERPFGFLRSGLLHRALIARLAWRRIQVRYRGSMLGAGWLLLQPTLMLGIYTLVFSWVFDARWGAALESSAEFGLFLFSGVLLYSIFSECVNEAPTLMLKNETYIVQIRFPLEILSWVSLLSSVYLYAIGTVVLLFFHLVIIGLPPVTWLLLPIIVIPIALLTLGLSWFIAAVGVYFRDISQMTVMFTTALLFMSPVFYPASRIPDSYRGAYDINPFAVLLEASKDILFFGREPNWGALFITLALAYSFAWLGFQWFMRTKRGFADVV